MCMWVYLDVYHVCVYATICMCVYMCICMCIMYVTCYNMYVYMYVYYVYVYVCICVYVHMYYVCVHYNSKLSHVQLSVNP